MKVQYICFFLKKLRLVKETKYAVFLKRFKNKLKFRTHTMNQSSFKYACKENTDYLKSKVLCTYFASYAKNTTSEKRNK